MKKSDLKPFVSVIIATKNEQTNIERLLISLTNQAYKHMEIIVVDNFSADQTKNIAKEYTDNVFEEGGERSKQRNYGAKKARGNYLLFLDADMELSHLVFVECIGMIKNQSAHAIVIPEDVKGSSLFARIKKLEKRLYWYEPSIEAARFFQTKAFWKVGGYNEDLIAGEDWDLSNRIATQWRLTRTKRPLWHYEISFWRELRHKWYYAKNISAYARLHPQSFSLQSGITRLRLFWRKRQLLLAEPLTASGLIVIKSLEYIIYVAARWLTR